MSIPHLNSIVFECLQYRTYAPSLLPLHTSQSLIVLFGQKPVCYICIPCSADPVKTYHMKKTVPHSELLPIQSMGITLTASHISPSSGFGSLSNNPMLVSTVEMFRDGCHAPCLDKNSLSKARFKIESKFYDKNKLNRQKTCPRVYVIENFQMTIKK